MSAPWNVMTGHCDQCEREVSDGEQALYAWGRLLVCDECYEILSEEFDEEARQEEAAHEQQASGHDRDSWLNFASVMLTGRPVEIGK